MKTQIKLDNTTVLNRKMWAQFNLCSFFTKKDMDASTIEDGSAMLRIYKVPLGINNKCQKT
ncbi:hypothetical protein GCM10023231_25850 [Olivibacter ginsenosidimutans]|uniref:Uncharacterized protein n=1 Tax=Olivibacter ginsenosidimutans TaxID=1176537 RepID=A0ABP9BM72_9SPHI